jgi:uncharacterized RDD family membrane protein YckC
MDRQDLGSWLSGPGSAPDNSSAYAGQRLGLPPHGPGSVAGWGRRFAALALDWFASMLVARLIFGSDAFNGRGFGWLVLGVFFVESTLLIWTAQASFGQRVLGVQVVRAATAAQGAEPPGRIGLLASLLRQFLIALVIPAVISNSDRRGLHDLVAGSVVVRAGGRDPAVAS